MNMHIFVGPKNPHATPVVIETNLAWAIPYWTERKRLNPLINWKFK
jgi:hypothetical protein